ncbi:hypothetical protein D0S45_17315 [Marinifilum sp. JC120]|nr:hypothetical protein D0S45_17315 [Marinifilum sp. JC120]
MKGEDVIQKRISFDVLGSKENIYTIDFEFFSKSGLRVICSCPAGNRGNFCKHVEAIIKGDDSILDPDFIERSKDKFQQAQQAVKEYGLDKELYEYETMVNNLKAEKKQIESKILPEIKENKSKMNAEKRRFSRRVYRGVNKA